MGKGPTGGEGQGRRRGGNGILATTTPPTIVEMTKIGAWEGMVEIGGSTGLTVAKLLWWSPSDLGAWLIPSEWMALWVA